MLKGTRVRTKGVVESMLGAKHGSPLLPLVIDEVYECLETGHDTERAVRRRGRGWLSGFDCEANLHIQATCKSSHRDLDPMILRRLLVWTGTLSVFSLVVRADNAFDCHLTVDSFKFDLTNLGGERTLSRTRDTPPSSMLDTVRFDLCADLTRQNDIAEADQVCAAVGRRRHFRCMLTTLRPTAAHL